MPTSNILKIKQPKMDVKLLGLFCVFFTILASFPPSIAYPKDDEECTYVMYVQTGKMYNAGTHAKVRVELRDIYLNRVNVTNLASHGVMGKWYDEYFERANLDAFAVKAKCLDGPVCSMTLRHDNAGFAPAWYVDFVDVTAISPRRPCRKTKFPVHGWLAVDKPPYDTRWGVYLCDEIVHHGTSKCSSEN